MKRIFALYFSICVIFITSITYGDEPPLIRIINPIPDTTDAGMDYTINAEIVDDGGVESAALYYRIGGIMRWNVLEMLLISGDRHKGVWSATIPGFDVKIQGLAYYLSATYAAGNTGTAGSADNPIPLFISGTITAIKSPTLPLTDANAFKAFNWRMVALPVDVVDESPAGVFDQNAGWEMEDIDWTAWGWDTSTQTWLNTLPLSGGKGAVVMSFDERPLTVAGTSRDITTKFSILLEVGWNLVSNTFSFGRYWNDDTITVRVDEEEVPITEASLRDWAYDTIYWYNPDGPPNDIGGEMYDASSSDPNVPNQVWAVDNDPTTNFPQVLSPYSAFWVLAWENCELLISPISIGPGDVPPTPSVTTSDKGKLPQLIANSQASVAEPLWKVVITAVSGSRPPITNVFGFDANATNQFDAGLDLVAPPFSLGYPSDMSVVFESEAPTLPPIPLDLRQDIRSNLAWILKVVFQNSFTLSWDASAVPDEVTLVLDPGDGSPLIDMKAVSSKDFPAGNYNMNIVGWKTITIISPNDGDKFPVGAIVEVVAEVRDQLGNPMAGVEVTFAATGGTVNPITVLTDENGQATTLLTVAEGENIVTAIITTPEGDITDTVTVTGGFPVPTTIEIISPKAGDKFCVGSIIDIVVEVRDQFGQPMAGVEVCFSCSPLPCFFYNPPICILDDNGCTITDEYGQAKAQLTLAEGSNIVTVTVEFITDTIIITSTRLPGDVSGNCEITAYDASLVLQYVVGLIDFSTAQRQAADVTGNGTITALDAALILQYTVGLITKFPAQGAPILTGKDDNRLLTKIISELENSSLSTEQKQVLEQLNICFGSRHYRNRQLYSKTILIPSTQMSGYHFS